MESVITISDSLKTYLMQNRLGKYNEEELEKREALKKREEEMELEKLKTCEVGLRCQVRVPGQPIRRATIKFIGELFCSSASGLAIFRFLKRVINPIDNLGKLLQSNFFLQFACIVLILSFY